MKRFFTPLLLAVGLIGAPAFADEINGTTASASDVEILSPAEPLTWYEGFAFQDSAKDQDILTTTPIESDTFALNWNGSGRWNLTLDLTRRSENLILPAEEITAGAYFQVTPRFRFGGGISFSGEDVMTDTSKWMDDTSGETNVRIESAFSF